MKIKRMFPLGALLALTFSMHVKAQVPSASFTLSPNPVCSGSTNVVQITDQSTGSPSSWSYTVTGLGPGGGITLSVQNPTITFNGPGVYTVTLIATNGNGSSAPTVQTLTVLASPNGNINPTNINTCTGGNPVNLLFGGGGPGGGANNTYSWSTGASTSSITVSPSVTTIYTCVVTGSTGCTVERTATVTVGPASVAITSNPVNLCPGTSSTLTATGTNPGPFTYSWSTGVTTRTISTSISGVFDVTVTNSQGCMAIQSYTLGTSSTLSLTAITNPSVLCAGGTATLHVTGASTYSWDNGSSGANVTVTPLSNTTYTVDGFIGTCTGSTIIQLSVNATPTITTASNYSAICNGNAVVLTASGATSYTWLPGSVGASVSVTPSVSTTYVVRGNTPGCPTRTAALAVTVYTNPVISINSNSTTTCAGELVALAAFGADTYTWNTGSNSTVYIVQPTITTTYTLTGSSVNGCTTVATITQTVNVCSGIRENGRNNDNALSVFPNPAKGNIRVEIKDVADCILFDQTGKVIRTFNMNSGSMDISGLPGGLYYLKAKTSSTLYTRKIVIMND